jgi:hypothetical protein
MTMYILYYTSLLYVTVVHHYYVYVILHITIVCKLLHTIVMCGVQLLHTIVMCGEQLLHTIVMCNIKYT